VLYGMIDPATIAMPALAARAYIRASSAVT
jgi:hypothetical protein